MPSYGMSVACGATLMAFVAFVVFMALYNTRTWNTDADVQCKPFSVDFDGRDCDEACATMCSSVEVTREISAVMTVCLYR